MPIHSLPERILRTKFYKNGMPIHSLPERILRTNFTKRKCQYTHCQNEFSELNFTKTKMPIHSLPERILRTKFYKTKMPIHSLPERILRTTKMECQYTFNSQKNFTKCQYTHCQNEFSEQILQNENANTLIARTNSQN
jgi:hypothetical protein